MLIIIFSQFFATSLWFAGNAVLGELIRSYHLSEQSLTALTSAVQLGFITGTLLFSFLSISDRFSPTRVFFISALLAAAINALILLPANRLESLILWRYLCGFFLAGIYPVGMKIASDYFKEGLGLRLSYLLAALVLGTAFPHFLNNFFQGISWKLVIVGTSAMALIAGLVMLFLPDGPYQKKTGSIDLKAIHKSFKNPGLRQAALGYFGHMWELYTFWAFVPVMLSYYQRAHGLGEFNVPLLSFAIIASGSASCVLAGMISRRFTERAVAYSTLLFSASLCLFSPFVFMQSNSVIFLVYLFLWGMAVVADSPLFSSMVAKHAEASIRGSALTLVNSIGFAVTVLSLLVLTPLYTFFESPWVFALLALGPLSALLIQRDFISQPRS